jgi:hypothetical protein
MAQKIAVETLTLPEISDLFRQSLEIAHPRAERAIAIKMKKLTRAGVSNHKWVQPYEIFKGAKFNFYCLKIPKESEPLVSIGMIHRTLNGLLLIAADLSGGGISDALDRPVHWDRWVNVYTAHYCQRYAERIMQVPAPTFNTGAEAIMFSNIGGVARITDTISEGVDEIELQSKEGQSFGYRDTNSKIIYYKTVYSNDMLKGDRRAFMEKWKDSIGQVNELFKRD